MHRQEHKLTDCCDCGATIVPATYRAFALNDDEFLCFDCAVRRGAAFDEAQERWTVPPDLADLADVPDERRARVHP